MSSPPWSNSRKQDGPSPLHRQVTVGALPAAAKPADPVAKCRSGQRLGVRAITPGSSVELSSVAYMSGRRTAEMATHSFTLVVEGPDLQSDEVIDALFDAGCDDALVGRADGIQYVDFDREADSLEDAVLSAVVGIEQIDGLAVVRIADAGLVSMADIAARTGRTRESIRLLISGERGHGGFPAPVTDPRSRYRLWRIGEVEQWMRLHTGQIDESRDDHVLAAINAGLELRQHSAHVSSHRRGDLRDLVGL